MSQRILDNIKCSDCGCDNIDFDPVRYEQTCTNCGIIIDECMMETQMQFTAEGRRIGTVVDKTRKSIFGCEGREANIQKKQNKMKTKLQYIASKLENDDTRFETAIEYALRVWKMCFEKRLTRGYNGEQLAAILLYMACREMRPVLPYLLIDFSAILEINVYKLASKFHKLCNDIPIAINSLTDPSIYIARFVHMLEFENETGNVTMTACKLVDQMQQDWITSGRRPSGICGAAILIAARMHGFKRSVKDIANVVYLSEATIKKRIKEFLDTKISQINVKQFIETSREVLNMNAKKRKQDEQETPPIIKQQQKQFMKLQKMNATKMEMDIFNDDEDIEMFMKLDDMDLNIEKKKDDKMNKIYGIVLENACIESALDLVKEVKMENDNGNRYEMMREYKGSDDMEERFKYWEENSLSDLDDDPEVNNMILVDKDEIAAKTKMFMINVPDWIKVNKDMDRMEMIREKKQNKLKSRKRKLNESYKEDKCLNVMDKVSKRFKISLSDKLNKEAFYKFMAKQPLNSNSNNMSEQDPLS